MFPKCFLLHWNYALGFYYAQNYRVICQGLSQTTEEGPEISTLFWLHCRLNITPNIHYSN